MKQAKKLTYRQKLLLDKMRMNACDYLVIAEGKSAILLQNKHTGQVIRKFISEVLR